MIAQILKIYEIRRMVHTSRGDTSKNVDISRRPTTFVMGLLKLYSVVFCLTLERYYNIVSVVI